MAVPMTKPMTKPQAPAAVDQALAGRRSLNATKLKAPPQDLSGAANGTITGRGGNVQQLGAAARQRLQQPTPPIMDPAQKPMPAWQQLAQQGIGGQGSAAANRALAANTGGSMPQIPGGPNVFHPTNPAAGGGTGAPTVDIQGHAPVFGTAGQQLGTPGAMDPGTAESIRRMGGTPPPGAPGPFNANLGTDIAQRLANLRMGQGSPPPGGGANPDAVRMMGGENAANNPALWSGQPGMGKPPAPAFTDFWAQPGVTPTGQGGGIIGGVANPGGFPGGAGGGMQYGAGPGAQRPPAYY